MATCKHCGRWLGQAMKPTPAAADPELAGARACFRCRWAKVRIAIEAVACGLMIVAALICLWGAWEQDNYWPDGDEMQHIRRDVPEPPAQPHIDPEPNSDGAVPEELPRVPSGQSALVMSIDY